VCAETRKHCLGKGGKKRTERYLARRLLYFFATLTKECSDRVRFQTRQETRSAIFWSCTCKLVVISILAFCEMWGLFTGLLQRMYAHAF
jgi:hypothetical protein